MKALFPLSPAVAIGICTVLGVVGALVLTGVGIYAFKKLKNRSGAKGSSNAVLPGILNNVGNSPLVAEFEKIVAAAIHQNHHAVLNALVAKLFPGLAPFLTGPIDNLADKVLDDVVGKSSATPPPLPVIPSTPTPVQLPIPLIDLLHKTVETFQQQQQQRRSDKAA